MRRLFLAGVAVLSLSVAACDRSGPAPTADTSAPASNAVAAAAAAPTSNADMEAAIARHVKAVKSADVEGVMADYADEAILVAPPGTVNPSGTFVGKTKVRDFFNMLASPEVLPGAQSMVTSNEIVGPDTLLFRWTQWPGTPKEVKGWDVFVFRNGKIVFQTTAPLPKAS